jgi:hypothetical protein
MELPATITGAVGKCAGAAKRRRRLNLLFRTRLGQCRVNASLREPFGFIAETAKFTSSPEGAEFSRSFWLAEQKGFELAMSPTRYFAALLTSVLPATSTELRRKEVVREPPLGWRATGQY